jgi:hypothetical protein
MSVTAGRRFGPYEILSPIGAGGTGPAFAAILERRGFGVTPSVLTRWWRP